MSESRTALRRGLLVALAAAVAIAAALLVAWKAYDLRRDRDTAAEQAFGIDRADVPAPPLSLTTFDGKRLSLADLAGQVVFVNFWATWCPPCRAEMPSMAELGRSLEARHPGKFRMVAVSVDDGWEPIAQFFGGTPPQSLTVTLDTELVTTQAYYCKARGACPDDGLKFPESYIVDKRGRLVAYVVGPRDWSDPAAARFLERLIVE